MNTIRNKGNCCDGKHRSKSWIRSNFVILVMMYCLQIDTLTSSQMVIHQNDYGYHKLDV